MAISEISPKQAEYAKQNKKILWKRRTMESNTKQRIKMLRERERYTLKEMAEKLEVSLATAQRYESNSGIKEIPKEIIQKYAKIFNVSPAYIMGWDSSEDESNTAQPEEQYEVQKQMSWESDSIKVLVDRLNELAPRKRIKVIGAFLTMLDYDTN